ncbi:hypothetical protein NA56DRAFT_709647 [Hyaloscypha hepaticicola]|uniref:Uncharacterized protein n=1 Tax=Hyaloscypha hepaticicola TaxID=2082293 RepID=A0A2J6PNA4_9HELO|nr:hypothetical protein NA56DRAFT_709647 [Hyaloscypha hepaticicola]
MPCICKFLANHFCEDVFVGFVVDAVLSTLFQTLASTTSFSNPSKETETPFNPLPNSIEHYLYTTPTISKPTTHSASPPLSVVHRRDVKHRNGGIMEHLPALIATFEGGGTWLKDELRKRDGWSRKDEVVAKSRVEVPCAAVAESGVEAA